MKLSSAVVAAFAMVALPMPAQAAEMNRQHAGHDAAPYAGEETRAIASLSEQDIDALLAGEGWGLAKPAELRGYPGPRHVLDLAGELDLSKHQIDAIEDAFSRMNERARVLGAEYVEAERALDALFAARTATPEQIRMQLAESERLLAELRYVHLAAHLEITPLLGQHQRHLYSRLRGYGAGASHAH